MNKEILSGNWQELKGKIKQQWGKLTDDDLTVISGNKDELYGKLKKYYGYNKEEINKKLKDLGLH